MTAGWEIVRFSRITVLYGGIWLDYVNYVDNAKMNVIVKTEHKLIWWGFIFWSSRLWNRVVWFQRFEGNCCLYHPWRKYKNCNAMCCKSDGYNDQTDCSLKIQHQEFLYVNCIYHSDGHIKPERSKEGGGQVLKSVWLNRPVTVAMGIQWTGTVTCFTTYDTSNNVRQWVQTYRPRTPRMGIAG
jgi:hypothetical protein